MWAADSGSHQIFSRRSPRAGALAASLPAGLVPASLTEQHWHFGFSWPFSLQNFVFKIIKYLHWFIDRYRSIWRNPDL